MGIRVADDGPRGVTTRRAPPLNAGICLHQPGIDADFRHRVQHTDNSTQQRHEKEIWRELTCTAINPILVKLGFQTVGRDHKEQKKYELTGKGREYGIYLDVGKRRSDGTPVRQLKWYESVIDKIKEHLESQFTGLTA